MKYRSIQTLTAALALLSQGCAIPTDRSGTGSLDNAFTAYWPPKEQNGKLRLAVKDLIDMKGHVTTAGSEYVAKNNPPAQHDAVCLAIARARNVQIVGRNNLSEFALGVSGMNDYFGTPVNPMRHFLRMIPGGSSSGSAVAVANDEADVSFGSDTNGSIRIPAAFCGVYGLKTTYGLVSLKGVWPLSPDNLDTIGPMAKDVNRLAQGMDLLQRGFATKYHAASKAKPTGASIKVGRLLLPNTDPKIERAVTEALEKNGFEVVVLDDDFRNAWLRANKNGKTVALSDGWLNNQKFLDKPGVSPITKSTIRLGRIEYKENYQAALAERANWRRTLDSVFEKVDFIALPTIKRLPPRQPMFGRSALLDGAIMSTTNTPAVNYSGNPAIAIPIPLRDSLVPLTSLQLVGPPLSEADLINAARVMESAGSPARM